MAKTRTTLVIGVDLAGSPGRMTGICLLRGMTVAFYATVHGDNDILSFIQNAKPALVAVDAPLGLPRGRTSLEERSPLHFRESDLELRRRGIRFFPLTLGPMRMLTKRGMRLKKVIEKLGIPVIEIYPGAAQDIWKISRKQGGLARLRRGLEKIGLKGLAKDMNGDELDAVTGALVGRLYLRGRAEVLGDVTEGAIIVPQKQQ
jgi:predicted nuclease with RNAse H fold